MAERMDCPSVEELAAARALGALDPAEVIALDEHLATCSEPHPEARSLAGAPELLAAALEPVSPSDELRGRVMASIAATPQDAEPGEAGPHPLARHGGWRDHLRWRPAVALAGVAVLVAASLGAWNLGLQSSISSRDAALREVGAAIEGAEAAYRVTGSAGAGYLLVDANGGAKLVVAGLVAPPTGHIYEVWLIDADGKPVAVGTADDAAGQLVAIDVERDVAGYATLAVTVETHRVDAPTTPPVLLAQLGSG